MTEETIFSAALEMQPAERAAYLAKVCGGDTALCKRLEGLLAVSDKAGNFMARPIVASADLPDSATEIFDGNSTPNKATVTRDGPSREVEDSEALAFLTPSSRPDSLGRIGHYEVLQVLGKGGFGIVYRAFDDVLQRVVAVKVMAPQLAATSPARKRFLREARTSAAIRHENVVQVYEVAEHPLPYLAMEFIPGETLQQKLDRMGPIDAAEVVRIGRQIAEGLAAAHATDLIHRDIKPANVLIDGGPRQQVKITDFGLARAADDASISQSGIIAGTPMYMAPEQALGHKLDQRADLFSLGSVLYQMAAGRSPFRANGMVAVLKRVAEDTPRDIREIIPETPQWLCDIIAKLHEKNPDDRYQTARDVADVLADCESQLKTNSKLKDFSRIPRGKPQSSGRRKWVAAAAIVLLPVIAALAVTKFAGVYPFWRPTFHETTPNSWLMPRQAEKKETPVPAAKQEPPPLAVAPFDAAQAKNHQEAWAKHLGVPVEFTNSIGMTFRLIPPGEFTMGTSPEEAAEIITNVPEWAREMVLSETPARKVRILKPFYLGTTEVTVGQFKKFVAATKYMTQAETNGRGGKAWTGEQIETKVEFTWRHPDLTLSDSHPVGQLCPEDANAFCRWLQTLEGRTYRLPDEVQWEYATRAGTVTPWSCGTDADTLKLHGLTEWHPVFTGRVVAQKPANPFGLFDVHGNLDEMCLCKDGGYVNRGGVSGINQFMNRSASRGSPIDRLNSYYQQSFRVAIVGDLKPTTSPQTPVLVANPEPLPPTFKNSIGMEFVIVPKGKSWLGGGKDKLGHNEVEISADFYLGKYAVTQEEWEKVMGENPSHFSRTNGGDAVKGIPDADLKRFPVEQVSWDQCQIFVTKLNKQEKETGWVYRVPKEAEWEYACRGGPMSDKLNSAFDFYFAEPTNTLLPEEANFEESGLKRTCKVGSYKPNKLGLYDMHGNVLQWCADLYDPKASGPGAPGRVARGGSWSGDGIRCQAAYRDAGTPSGQVYVLGLRLARVPTVQEPVPPTFKNSIGMEFVIVPKGKFMMGSSQEEIDRFCAKIVQDQWAKDCVQAEGPEHPVEITQPFYMGATEVTVGEFRQFVEEEGYQVGDARWRNPGFDQTDKHPVVWVTWNNAVDFCKWLSKKEGKEYRLPTEAEWEYSCRAGKTGSRYGFGDDEAQLENYAWCNKNAGGGTHPVGKKKPNDWGLYDMHGNVWELCQDNYDPDYYKNSPVKDPPGPGTGGVWRGGSWRDPPGRCRSACRNHAAPGHRDHICGFRVALSVSPPAGVGTASGTKNKSAAASAPFTDADVQRIAALPAEQQVEEVRKELMRRNPEFDGKMETKIEGGVVTEFKIVTDKVTDIAPIRVFNALRVLDCQGTFTDKSNGTLVDLTPLERMNLACLEHLNLDNTKVGDAGLAIFKDCKKLLELHLWNTKLSDAGLANFKDCKNLTVLALSYTRVSDAGLVNFKDCKNFTVLGLTGTRVSDADLIHFKDCKDLTVLHLADTRVSDAGLANLKGMRLTYLEIEKTPLSDLSPLQGMPLEEIHLTPKNITKGLDILRDMKSLKTIGIGWEPTWPAAEFWERYDKGEFTK